MNIDTKSEEVVGLDIGRGGLAPCKRIVSVSAAYQQQLLSASTKIPPFFHELVLHLLVTCTKIHCIYTAGSVFRTIHTRKRATVNPCMPLLTYLYSFNNKNRDLNELVFILRAVVSFVMAVRISVRTWT